MDPIDFLIQQNHRCIYIIQINNGIVKWCGQSVCPDAILYDKLLKKENERRNFKQSLINNNHTCIFERETFPVKIIWCRNEICDGIVIKKNMENKWRRLC